MTKMNLNIHLFDGGDKELAMNPTAFNSMVEQYDGEIPTINSSFANNKEALATLKAVAGSPTMSAETKPIIQGLTRAIDETANYFDSVNAWSNETASTAQNILGSIGLETPSQKVNRETLDEIQESFEGGFVGISSPGDIDNFVSALQTNVIPILSRGLSTITSAVAGANGSLPAEVKAALSSTISTNNDDILDGYSKANQYLTQNLEKFKSELTSFSSNAAAAARGND